MGKIWENAFHSAVSCCFPAWCQMASPWSASIDPWHASWNRPQALCQQPPCAQALAAALAETMSPRIAWCRVLDAATVAKFIGKRNQVQAWKEHLCDDCFHLFPVSIFHVCYFHLSIRSVASGGFGRLQIPKVSLLLIYHHVSEVVNLSGGIPMLT